MVRKTSVRPPAAVVASGACRGPRLTGPESFCEMQVVETILRTLPDELREAAMWPDPGGLGRTNTLQKGHEI